MQFLSQREELNPMIKWLVVAIAVELIALSLWLNYWVVIPKV